MQLTPCIGIAPGRRSTYGIETLVIAASLPVAVPSDLDLSCSPLGGCLVPDWLDAHMVGDVTSSLNLRKYTQGTQIHNPWRYATTDGP